MTVGELIVQLQKLPATAVVALDHPAAGAPKELTADRVMLFQLGSHYVDAHGRDRDEVDRDKPVVLLQGW